MPLVEIDLPRELYESRREAISDAIHDGLIAGLDVPTDDKFQVFRPRDDGQLAFDPTYGGVDRQQLVLIRILMVHRYSVEEKRTMFREVVERLGDVGVRSPDVLIAVTENDFHDWFAGSHASE